MTRNVLVFLFVLGSMFAHAQPVIDVLHYRFHIRLNDSNDTIYGKAEIKVKFMAATSQVEFDLGGVDPKGKGMFVSEVKGAAVKAFSRLQERIQVQLSGKTKLNDTATFTIQYHGVPADGLIISKNKYGHRSFFADNWPNRGHNWIPCVDHPADKATVEFLVTAPQHYQVVANGIQVEETNQKNSLKLTHWKEDADISTKVMVIGVAEFAVNLAGVVDGCIPVYSWVYPEDRDKGFYDYSQALEILPWYIKQVGPYGYKKLANVQSKTTFGGLENANTIFYSETSITGNRNSESLLAHEIAHQWFGNMATEKSFAHLWLSEGFATYMTILYMESKYGIGKAKDMLIEDRDQVFGFLKKEQKPVVDENPDYMQLLNVNSYQKGGWVLHMLRRQLGDSVFWKSIRKYYSLYAGKTADTDDLRKVFESVSGKKLETFFKQWLYTPVQPRVQLSWKYDSKIKKLMLSVKQEKATFEFPLEIGFKDINGNMSIQKFNISKPLETFTINLKDKPVAIVADPNVALLAETVVEEFR